jgi:hypothetical protein
VAKSRARIDQSLFQNTEEGAPAVEVPAEGKTTSISVGLRATELELLEKIADEYQVTKNALLRLAARRLIEDVLSGRLDLEGMIEEPPPPRRRIKLP